MNEVLTAQTASIVAAFVARQDVQPGQVPDLIASTYRALEDLGKPSAPAPDRREPAVSLRASVRADKVVCLECGHAGKMLARHLTMAHGLTPKDYRERWALPATHPLTAPNYSDRRRVLAKEIGLGRNGGGRRSSKKEA